MTDRVLSVECCGNVARATLNYFQCVVCKNWYDSKGRKYGYGANFAQARKSRTMKGVDIDRIHKVWRNR